VNGRGTEAQSSGATHADFRIMPAAGGGGTNRSFAVAADVVARAARGHLNWFVLNLPKKELINGVDWWSLFFLEQPQPQVSLLESFKDFASQ